MREGSRRSISICGDEFWVSSGLPLGWSNAQNQRHRHNKNNWAVASRRFLHSERSHSGLLFRQQQLCAAYLLDRKSTRLNSSHTVISYAVFCLKKKKQKAAQGPVIGRFGAGHGGSD